eukprot:sb/3478511/
MRQRWVQTQFACYIFCSAGPKIFFVNECRAPPLPSSLSTRVYLVGIYGVTIAAIDYCKTRNFREIFIFALYFWLEKPRKLISRKYFERLSPESSCKLFQE